MAIFTQCSYIHMSKSDIHHRYLQLYNLRRTILRKKKCSNFRDWLLFLVRILQPVNILSHHSIVLTKLQEGTKNAESTGWKLILKFSTMQFSTQTGLLGRASGCSGGKTKPWATCNRVAPSRGNKACCRATCVFFSKNTTQKPIGFP